MSNKFFIFIVIIVVGGILLFSCNVNREEKADKVKEDVGQTEYELKKTQIVFDEEWKKFKINAEFNIKVNEKRIEELNKDIKTASKKFKSEYEKKINMLGKKNLELKNRMVEYRYEGTDNWKEFQEGFNSEADLLGNAFNNLFAKND